MAGEGSMMHAIHTMRNNKALLKEKKGNWKDYVGAQHIPTKDSIKATPELLEEIKTRLQAENKKRKKHQIMLALLSIIVTILVIYLITKINYVGIQMDSGL